MPKTGEDEVIGEDAADFGGDDVEETTPPKEHADEQYQRKIEGSVAPAGTVQANQGPQASKQYGTSVPIEGKRNEGPTDFNHPATVEPQRIIWVPADPLGLGDVEANYLNAAGVEASTEHATMSEGGKVDIDSHPPGMDPNTIFG